MQDPVLSLGRPGERELNNVDHVPVNAGDTLTIMMGGGSGYGDALKRDPQRVLEDVIQGFVSRQAAAAPGHDNVDMLRHGQHHADYFIPYNTAMIMDAEAFCTLATDPNTQNKQQQCQQKVCSNAIGPAKPPNR